MRNSSAFRRHRRSAAVGLLLALLAGAGATQGQASPTNAIFTCVDENGRRITSDRLIAACSGREQLLLNRDGSLRAVIPPSLTAEERAEKEARDRKAAEVRTAQLEAVRRDRNLVARFPDEPAHQKAREAALDTVRQAIQNSETRLRELNAERRPLMSELEFYQGKPVPAALRQKLDANDVALEAQRTLAAHQAAELGRINALYDAELQRLKRLWAGAAPGSLGPLPTLPPAVVRASSTSGR
jgi:hypothetical protein